MYLLYVGVNARIWESPWEGILTPYLNNANLIKSYCKVRKYASPRKQNYL